MKAKLIVEGREFLVEINDPELQKLLKPPKRTGYERVYPGDDYFYIVDAEVCSTCDTTSGDENCYEVANYYSDSTVAANNARADKLMRQLRRFAVEHREKVLDWNDEYQYKYYVCYDYSHAEFYVNKFCSTKHPFNIYFDSEKYANLAIKTFRNELFWYFTEYKDSL